MTISVFVLCCLFYYIMHYFTEITTRRVITRAGIESRTNPPSNQFTNLDESSPDQFTKIYSHGRKFTHNVEFVYFKKTNQRSSCCTKNKHLFSAILVEDHPGTIPAEFGQITISGSREDVV